MSDYDITEFMKHQHKIHIRLITRKEIWAAELALFIAVGLQIITWRVSGDLRYGPHPFIIATELGLITLIGLYSRHPRLLAHSIYRTVSFMLLAVLSIENISAIAVVSNLLISGSPVDGYNLLVSAIAIFLTNIIVFSLWYWEIDSPGLSGKRWSRHDKDFQFTQQDMPRDFPDWQPTFIDYMYLSLTNAINFAAADTKPITHQAKALMGLQAMLSALTLALIIARSVSILGQ